MEKTITNPFTLIISCLTSGVFSGILGGCCPCLPIFSGIGVSILYRYIEKATLTFPGVLLASIFSGVIASIPASLINVLAISFSLANKEVLPPDLKMLLVKVSSEQLGFINTFLSTSIFFVILSLIGGIFHYLLSTVIRE